MLLTLHSLEETKNFAHKLAKLLIQGDVIALTGELGSGKTTLAQYIIKYLCGEEAEVISPTFNLVQLYPALKFTIWHFDLYRLKSAEEIIELGLDEAVDSGVSIIEWPQIAENLLPKEKLLINLACGTNNERVVSLECSGKWGNIWKSEKN